MADWAGLLPDMLFLIASRITEAEDFISFRSICSTWRHTTLRTGSTRSLKPFRWNDFGPTDEDFTVHKIYSFKKDKFYQVSVPEVTTRMLYLTNDWFFTKSPKGETSLVHPFSRQVIPLPPLANCLKKVVLSSSPTFSPKDFAVLVLTSYTGDLYFCKSKDQEWTMIKNSGTVFEDMIYCKGQIYASDKQGVVYACNVRGCNPIAKVPICTLKPWPWYHFTSLYLVENIDNPDCVLMVVNVSRLRCDVDEGNFYRDNNNYTVFEVDLSEKGGWKKINDLGSRTIFLNHYKESFCIENSKFSPGIVENHNISICHDHLHQDSYSGTKSAHTIVILTWVRNLNDGIERLFFHPTVAAEPGK